MSKSRSLGSAVAFAVLSTAAFAAAPAKAVVYCKTAGVPQGCVVRPVPVVVAPVAGAAVVTGSHVTTPRGHSIARFHIHETQVGIDRGTCPDGRAAVFPGLSPARPGLRARLTRRRHRIEIPKLFPGFRI